MNILFVQDADWIKKVPWQPHHLLEKLSIKGHNIFVIDYEEDWKRNTLFELGHLSTLEYNNFHRLYDEASITVRRPGFIKILGLSRISSAITHSFEINRILKEKNIDIVLSNYPTNAFQTIFLSKIKKIPVVYFNVDLTYTLVSSKYSYLKGLVFLLERYAYRHADHVITITEMLKNYVIRMGADKERITIIPSGVDLQRFEQSMDVSDIVNRYSIRSDDHIILFVGSLFDFCGVDEVLLRMHIIIKKVPNTKFVVVGGGPLYEFLVKEIARVGLGKNVILTGIQPYDLVPKFISLADVCICSFHPNEATNDLSPLKIYEYMAGGKPVLMTNLPGTKSMIGDNHGVHYSDTFDDLAENIIHFLKNPDVVVSEGKKARVFIEKNCSWDAITPEFEKTLEQVINQKKHKMS